MFSVVIVVLAVLNGVVGGSEGGERGNFLRTKSALIAYSTSMAIFTMTSHMDINLILINNNRPPYSGGVAELVKAVA